MLFDSLHRVSRALGGIRRMHRASHTMAALSRLDDRLLNDIGISRSAIPGVAMELSRRPGHERQEHR